MSNIFLKTERFILRYLTQEDFEELKEILQDKDVMYAWEYEFSDNDVQNWIDKNLELYKKYNLGYFLMVENISGKILGQAALMPEIIDQHKGFATEAAKALKNYAFNNLNLNEIIFEIRPNNISSRKIAENLNAKITGKFIKNVSNKKMLHLIYKLTRCS